MIPRNEIELIVVFAQQAESAGWHIVSVQYAFPDGVVQREGCQYRVEFELVASSFVKHQHDLLGCDIIICWENDLPRDFPLPVIALSKPGWKDVEIHLMPDWLKEHKREAMLEAIEKDREYRHMVRRARPVIVPFGEWEPPKKKWKPTAGSKAEEAKLKALIDEKPQSELSHTRTPPDVLRYWDDEGNFLLLCPPCARARRSKGQALVVDIWVVGKCQDCWQGF